MNISIRSKKKKYSAREIAWRVLLNAILLTLAFLALFPFLWMLSSSLKAETAMYDFPIKWIPDNIKWDNYAEVFTKANFVQYYWNSIKISSVVTLGQVLTSVLAAYAFAKINFKGRDKIFIAYLGTMMVPFQVIMIPQFILFKYLGLLNHPHLALILPGIFTAFGTFMMRQFFLGVPDELSQAARIDGCNELGILVRIMLPLSKPAMASLAVFTFRWQWNDFLAPLIYIKDVTKKTIPIGLSSFQMENVTLYTLIMAGAIISIVPVVIAYILAQKSFVEGIATSGLKG
jgi:multiple sugar transport system permease protein